MVRCNIRRSENALICMCITIRPAPPKSIRSTLYQEQFVLISIMCACAPTSAQHHTFVTCSETPCVHTESWQRHKVLHTHTRMVCVCVYALMLRACVCVCVSKLLVSCLFASLLEWERSLAPKTWPISGMQTECERERGRENDTQIPNHAHVTVYCVLRICANLEALRPTVRESGPQ